MIHEKVMCCMYRKKFTRWRHHSVSFENIGGPVVGGPQVCRGCDEIKCCNMSLFLMDTSWPWMVFDVTFLSLISERSQVKWLLVCRLQKKKIQEHVNLNKKYISSATRIQLTQNSLNRRLLPTFYNAKQGIQAANRVNMFIICKYCTYKDSINDWN